MRGVTARAVSRAASALVLVALVALAAGPGASPARAATPHINHLFLIVLENKDAAETFGREAPAPYLATTMRAAGAYVPRYYGIGHHSLDNYIAMISGQPPNLATQEDCPVFSEMEPGTLGADGIAAGQGCVYPRAVRTLANQLEYHGYGWRGYMQDMAASVGEGRGARCRHPAIGGPDEDRGTLSHDLYATRHNPFVYFHSVLDFPSCQRNDVGLAMLPHDLASTARAPELALITPDVCADGHEAICPGGSSPAGYAGIDAFLRRWVPRIEASPAFQDRGAILVAFDEAESDAGSCCGETTGPNTDNNGGYLGGGGGGRVGAVMISPCIRPGTRSTAAYNHYSLLRWIEDDFGLSHLASAAAAGLRPFGRDVLNRPGCQRATGLRVRPRRAVTGRRTTFRIRLLTQLPACREGALIELAGRRARTDRHGNAQITARLSGRGDRLVTARPPICRRARARLRLAGV